MRQLIINTIRNMCNNGKHSCKFHDVMNALHCGKAEITDALQNAPFGTRLAHNVNGILLIVIEDN